MGKAISRDRAQKLFGSLQMNTSLEGVEDKVVEWVLQNPREAGKNFNAFLRNRCPFTIGEPKVIQIDRTKSFDPANFIGEGWSILGGEQDERSLALTEVNLHEVRLVTMLRVRERSVRGEERLRRLRENGDIRLDAKVFQVLWDNKHRIPEYWKERAIVDGAKFIYFDGTVLLSPEGDYHVLALYNNQTEADFEWNWTAVWLGSVGSVNEPSAVLASKSSAA